MPFENEWFNILKISLTKKGCDELAESSQMQLKGPL